MSGGSEKIRYGIGREIGERQTKKVGALAGGGTFKLVVFEPGEKGLNRPVDFLIGIFVKGCEHIVPDIFRTEMMFGKIVKDKVGQDIGADDIFGFLVFFQFRADRRIDNIGQYLFQRIVFLLFRIVENCGFYQRFRYGCFDIVISEGVDAEGAEPKRRFREVAGSECERMLLIADI